MNIDMRTVKSKAFRDGERAMVGGIYLHLVRLQRNATPQDAAEAWLNAYKDSVEEAEEELGNAVNEYLSK